MSAVDYHHAWLQPGTFLLKMMMRSSRMELTGIWDGQGAQIIDDAFCGGPDLPQLNSSVPLISKTTANNTAAIILMGNPRHVNGLPFNVGNATAGGVSC